MKAPLQRGAAIDNPRMEKWLDRFRYYRDPPDRAAVRAWLHRFNSNDRDIAARILDCVEVISEKEIHEGYSRVLKALPGWHTNKQDRDGNWYFVGFGDAGESGQSMVRIFREANNLASEKYNYLFCNILDLPRKKATAADTIVFIDDFSGTGRQVCRKWPVIFELVASSDAQFYLVLTAATETAIEEIQEKTLLSVKTRVRIQKNENVFSASCHRFTPAERQRLLHYCSRADSDQPRGFGECGLLYVLSHKTPNNSIPILHVNNRNWRGLFPRYLNQEAD